MLWKLSLHFKNTTLLGPISYGIPKCYFSFMLREHSLSDLDFYSASRYISNVTIDEGKRTILYADYPVTRKTDVSIMNSSVRKN